MWLWPVRIVSWWGAHKVILAGPSHKTNIQTHWYEPDDFSSTSPPMHPQVDCKYRNKYDEHLLRNKIFPRNKYGWFLLTNPSQRERNCSAQLVGGCSTLSLQSEGASSQVIDAGNGQLWWLRWSWQWLKMFFSSSVQSADPNHPLLIWKRVPGRRLRRHSEQANGSKGGDASQDLRPLCHQELEEGACHRGQAEPPQHCLFGSKGSSMSATSTDAWSATWEDRALQVAGGDEQVVVQLSSSFLWQLQLCDGNGAMSMNMIVTTNEVLQLKYNKRENNFCSGDSLCSSMRSRQWLVNDSSSLPLASRYLSN